MFGKLAYIDIYNKSRMIGDHYVLFCERGRLELPLSTRLRDRCPQYVKNREIDKIL
ncbi:hypothetical protein JoomaDRAFT_0900 [Galbibacter orientalis DSM 19592]|uniref:Uncharacterized protein n=1 Tax=Galbibacter orientalis DSM 19592 TaxID=926559 RepID=I3C2T2_9FLAO|nr:hypothetical protein JoomaDRAFT_0900 [Galbibacter orientalis DSM 19592]